MLPTQGGPTGSPLSSQYSSDNNSNNGLTNKSDFSSENLNLETLLSDHAKLIKNRMFLNSRDTVSTEELELLLLELNAIRQNCPTLRENIRLIHRVRRQLNKITQYDESSFPPFLTIIEHEDKEKSVHPMNVAKILHEKNIPGIKEINFKGKNKIGVKFDSPFDANSFIGKNNLNGFRSYIPESMLYSRGIVKRIGDSITEEDFIKYGYGVRGSKIIKITDATRFNYKRVENGVTKIVPGSTYMLVFAGNLMPQEVNLFCTKREVTPYVQPVVLCYNCLKYGHHKQQCKTNTKCFHCGGTHLQESCPIRNETKKVCPNCSGDHPVNSRSCSEYSRQQKINQAVADHNITFFEANKLYPKENSPVENRIDVRTDFPNILQAELPTSQKTKFQPQSSYAARAAKKVKRTQDLTPNFDINAHSQLLNPNSFRTSSPNGSMMEMERGGVSPFQISNNTGEHEEKDMEVASNELIDNTQKSIIENIIGSQFSTDEEMYQNSQKFLDNLNSDRSK